jgi:hypothetical protein
MLVWSGLERCSWRLALLPAFLLPLTRAVGFFAALPILLRCLSRPGTADGKLRWGRCVVLAAAPLLGLGTYFLLMWRWTGNAFEGMEAQKYWGAHSISHLWNIPIFVIGLFTPTNWHSFSGSMLDRSMFMILLCSLPVVWRLGKDMLAWVYVLGILPAMSGTFVSFTRFESTAFPVFIALAVFFRELKTRWAFALVMALFSVLHLVLLWRFVNYQWAG